MPLLLPNLQDWYCCRRLAAAAAVWLPSHWIGSDSATMHAVVDPISLHSNQIGSINLQARMIDTDMYTQI